MNNHNATPARQTTSSELPKTLFAVFAFLSAATIAAALALPWARHGVAFWLSFAPAAASGIAASRIYSGGAGAAMIGASLAGCAACASLAFLGTLLIPPEPGTVYKWGGGFGGATAAALLAGGVGAVFGAAVGVIYGLVAAVMSSLRSHASSTTSTK